MRRLDAPRTGREAIEEALRLCRQGYGLEQLRRNLGEGATLADALRAWRKMKQESRTPCSFLDEELGIARD